MWWIETFTVHGPGDVQGEPSILTDEHADFVVDCYAQDVEGRRLYDSAFYSRPKGTDKSGLAAKLALLEAFGPCRFEGWARGGETYEFLGKVYTYRKGEAMARPVKVPYVRIMATEEGQTGNVYDTVHFNLTEEQAPLSALRAYGCDPGLSRVILPDGGEITPSTSGAASKDGGKETFAVFDETHLYNTPILRSMYRTVTRNLRKRKKIAGTWFLETTTMYAPGEQSVAEETYDLADKIEEGKARRAKLLFDHRWAEPKDLRNEANLADAFEEAYGDAIAWNSIPDLIDGVFDTRQPEADTRRYFFNALVSSSNSWIEAETLRARGMSRIRAAAKKAGTDWSWVRPWEKDVVTLGFDGSISDDATALVACRVQDRHIFPLLIEEVPDGPESEGWEVNQEAFDAAVADAFKRYTVVGFYADPPHWQDYIDSWEREFGKDLKVKSSAKSAIRWWTKRDVQMAEALERLLEAIRGGTVSFDDESKLGKQMMRHFINAKRWKRRGGTVIGKEGKNSPRKIDAAMAATLAFLAATDFGAKKVPDEEPDWVPFSVR
ncbi:hypothetical protein [Leifsonia sp. LS1]|uniref:hypothetical protein n=1 Tax=Leifsonia sp. LS1 TaxID=2828483 RepID=UPI001CFE4EE9|nr:hypothetical protein [Leifsonia sp. LS1]